VVGIHCGIVIFSFFYDVIGFQQQRCPFDICIHGSMVLTFGT